MNILTMEDMNYLTQQSTERINMILSGMTTLMNDTDNKVEAMESQGWFQRMAKTVLGKNKLTKTEIQQNHDKLNAYMSEAISELYNRNCIDHEVIMSLGTQLNELYADHVNLKQLLGTFVSKLNEKIDSVDNFHMLNTEINQGKYSSYAPIIAVCKIISQFDKRILEEPRKLDILKRSMIEQNIINNEEVLLSNYLMSIAEMSIDEMGAVYLELGTIRNNFMSDIILNMMDKYHFLPDIARRVKNKNSLIEDIIKDEKLDDTIKLSINDIYDDFLNSKINTQNSIIAIEDAQNDTKIEETEQEYTSVSNCDVEDSNSISLNNETEEINEKTLDAINDSCEFFKLSHYESKFEPSYKLKCTLDIHHCDKIYLAYDNTLFKSGKNGFAITSDGIYCRDFMASYTNYVSFKELLESDNIYWKDSYVYADDKLLAYYTVSDSEKDDLVRTIKQIKQFLMYIR